MIYMIHRKIKNYLIEVLLTVNIKINKIGNLETIFEYLDYDSDHPLNEYYFYHGS